MSTTDANDFHPQGTFKDTRGRQGYGGTGNGSAWALAGIVFDANNSNEIYGAASSVQPPALLAQYLIKY